MDILHTLLKFADHHRYTLIALAICIGLSGWLVGCQVKTQSVVDPAATVTPTQLAREVVFMQGQFDKQAASIEGATATYNAEVDTFNALITEAEADLTMKIERRRKIVEVLGGLGTLAAEGTLTPLAAIGSILQLLLAGGVAGLGADVIRKNRIIAAAKTD